MVCELYINKAVTKIIIIIIIRSFLFTSNSGILKNIVFILKLSL